MTKKSVLRVLFLVVLPLLFIVAAITALLFLPKIFVTIIFLIFIICVGFSLGEGMDGLQTFRSWNPFTDNTSLNRKPGMRKITKAFNLKKTDATTYSGAHQKYKIHFNKKRIKLVPNKSSGLEYKISSSGFFPKEQTIKTGDRTFDLYFKVSTPTAAILGLLNKEARGLIIKLNQFDNQVSLEPNCLQIEGYFEQDDIHNLVAIDSILKRDSDLKSLLLESYHGEPEWSVRLEYLKAVIVEFIENPDIKKFLYQCLEDRNIPIQILAAKTLGLEGTQHLVRILKTSPSHRTEVIGILSDFGPKMMETLLKDPETVGYAIPELATPGKEEWVDPFIQLFQNTEDVVLQQRIIQGLRNIGSSKANPFLISLLKPSNHFFLEDVISCLKKYGDKDAVAPLLQLGDSRSTDLGHICQEAVLSIQSRLGAVEKGWLSFNLGHPLHGGVSLPPAGPEGNLSMADSAVNLKNCDE